MDEELFEDVAPFFEGVSDYIDITENLDEKKLVVGFTTAFIATIADIETRLSDLEGS